MKNSDKFLVAIVVAVIILIGVAFAVAFTRPKPTYQSDLTPEGVAHNYLLAIQQGDYERAYGYLSPTIPGYPRSLDRFIRNIENYSYSFNLSNKSTSLEILSTNATGNFATVNVRETTFYEGDLFSSGESTHTFKVSLRQDANNGGWKITDSDSYWVWCWNNSDGCD